VLYVENALDNQRFALRPRDAAEYELSPRHAPGMCAEPMAAEVQIWPCRFADSSQAFRFERAECP
jgi:hypothetical protein